MKFCVKTSGFVIALTGLLLTACAEQQTDSSSTAEQVARNAPALAVLNEWCAGDSDWNPPVRVVDKLIEKDGQYYTIHGSSNQQLQFAKATEWMPGMNGPDLLLVTVDGSELHYTSKDGWRYVTTVRSATTTHLAASKSSYYNVWNATCQPVSK